jgi:EAL and modified HD-GYP domain-containing signal transduction protein
MTAKLQLLQELAAHEFEVPALAGIIAADVSLSYKLLTYINSVAFGLKRTVSSINQAVALLGRQPLKQWLMVVLLSDINPAPRGEALTFSAIQRGKFLEELGQEGGLEWPAETLFILGLFSNLDALLDQPMQDILQKMPIEPEVADALLGRSSRLGPLLELALAIESGGFDRAEALLAGLGLDPARAAVLHSRAATWAKGLLASEDAA